MPPVMHQKPLVRMVEGVEFSCPATQAGTPKSIFTSPVVKIS